MPADDEIIGKISVKVVEDTIKGMSSLTFSKDSHFDKREIIEYQSRMRVFGMEKFNGPCYIGVVNYYFSAEDQKNHDACGVFILFIEETNVGKFLKSLGYRGFDEDEEKSVYKPLGEFTEVLSSNFKKEIQSLGYQNLISSTPACYHNDISSGVEFSYDQYAKYESSFYLWKDKIVVVEVTIKPPR